MKTTGNRKRRCTLSQQHQPRIRWIFIAVILTICPRVVAQSQIPRELQFLDNGRVRVGLNPTSGGAIAWLSQSGSDRNLVNAYDRGRLIQQSYYGGEDGSLWDKKPWNWNPVQGGDWRGSPARVVKIEVTRNEAFVESIPRHWATGKELDDCRMEQRIRLDQDLIKIHFRFTYRGHDSHPLRDQEIPAVFVAADLKTLVLYSGDKPWTGAVLHRSEPGWPNESRPMDEHWAAYVDTKDFGLGAYVRQANRLTCYRFGSKPDSPDACSYFAPLTRFAVVPNFEWEYDAVFSIGTVEQLRSRFVELHNQEKK